ncbi:MAG: DUF2267 domain-containing protein [Fibrobacter sp.]|jgi:uncharacterized protein (DUF2267 family)|nr:DUF2267 domain-containing protein [Fibrobacter sp.]
MGYQILLQKVAALNFVSDESRADAMIKSVLGQFASRMTEEHAQKFTADLPEPLDYEKLRGHQAYVSSISLDQFITNVSEQFDIRQEQVQTLVSTIFHTIKVDILKEKSSFWQQWLPSDWAVVIKDA